MKRELDNSNGEDEENEVELRIKFGTSLPAYPMLHKEYDVSVLLIDENADNSEEDNLQLGQYLPLNIKVYYADKDDDKERKSPRQLQRNPRNGLANLVSITPAMPYIEKNGIAKFKVSFNDISMSHDNKKFIFRIETQIKSSSMKLLIDSSPITCVNNRLIIDEVNSQPYVWYKDEGGKDKCIELTVSLKDGSDYLVLDRKVPLKALLMYAPANLPVPQQSILTISPETKMMISETGKIKIKLRVNEVSNRHRGQMFQILISADTGQNPQCFDISPAVCVAIDVKSKRNHKGIEHIASGIVNKNTTTKISSTKHDNKRVRSDEKRLDEKVIPQDNKGKIFYNPSQHIPPASMGNALDNIVRWVTTVMNGIDYIQWRQIGFESNNNGLSDVSKPLYSIPNPQETLAEIVKQYTGSVMSSLEYLSDLSRSHHQGGEMSILNLSQFGSTTPGGSTTGLSLLNPVQLHNNDNNLPMNAPTANVWDKNSEQLIPLPSPRIAFDSLMLNREYSFGLLGGDSDMLGLSRGHSLSLDNIGGGNSGMNSGVGSPLNYNFFSDSNTVDDAEREVYYVIADDFISNSDSIGLPAFDISKNLLGFYKDSRNSFTKINFIEYLPISQLSLSKIEIQTLTSRLNAILFGNKQDEDKLFSLTLSKNNLRKMKDDAIQKSKESNYDNDDNDDYDNNNNNDDDEGDGNDN